MYAYTDNKMPAQSENKMQVLSDLNATRKIIKDKFRQAYMDRITRERKLTEVMKPVTSTMTKEFDKHRRLKDGNVKSPTSVLKFKPSRLATSTPKFKRSILRKTPKSKIKSKIYDSSNDDDASDSFHTLDEPSGQYDPFTYEFTHDDDRVDKYNLTPEESVRVHGIKTSKKTGQMKKINTKFRNLPKSEQQKWKEHRKNIGKHLVNERRRLQDVTDYSSESEGEGEASAQAASEISGVRKLRESTIKKIEKTKKGKGIGKHADLIGFNFIPYNANNRIVYEYFDNPNELIERLKLLISSRMAGNTNHMQEINSIIEELHELGLIA